MRPFVTPVKLIIWGRASEWYRSHLPLKSREYDHGKYGLATCAQMKICTCLHVPLLRALSQELITIPNILIDLREWCSLIASIILLPYLFHTLGIIRTKDEPIACNREARWNLEMSTSQTRNKLLLVRSMWHSLTLLHTLWTKSNLRTTLVWKEVL